MGKEIIDHPLGTLIGNGKPPRRKVHTVYIVAESKLVANFDVTIRYRCRVECVALLAEHDATGKLEISH